MNETVKSIITDTGFLTYIGAICGHILSLYTNEFKGAIPFFERIFPNKTQTFYFRIDFLILPIIGALIATVLLDPSNTKSAIFAGLSWSGTLTAFLKRNTEKITQSN
jgi:hypothetical protein